MTKGSLAVGGVVLLVGVYVAAAPYITVYQMRSAAEQRDGEALAEYIEFPSLRQSLKEQMNAVVLGQIAGVPGNKVDGKTVLGTALAVGLLDGAVDAWVTPSGIARLMEGEDLQAAEAGAAGQSDDRRAPPRSDAKMSYESIEKFVVRYDNQRGDEVKLVLRRRGLGWKMTEIILPLT